MVPSVSNLRLNFTSGKITTSSFFRLQNGIPQIFKSFYNAHQFKVVIRINVDIINFSVTGPVHLAEETTFIQSMIFFLFYITEFARFRQFL